MLHEFRHVLCAGLYGDECRGTATGIYVGDIRRRNVTGRRACNEDVVRHVDVRNICQCSQVAVTVGVHDVRCLINKRDHSAALRRHREVVISIKASDGCSRISCCRRIPVCYENGYTVKLTERRMSHVNKQMSNRERPADN